MRNLKRALSLALASVMLLGMMVVGTSAASYPDVSTEDNVEAIEVLNAVKVMVGDRGNFRPDAAVNRHEMAVIMAKLYLGSEEADSYVGTHPFTDVFPWADKYVAACYENGLVSGTSSTTFSGNQPLTAVQAASMMLRALGYENLSKGAADWRSPVTAKANEIRLFKDVVSSPSAQLTRNQVAQLTLNTLKADVVVSDIENDIIVEGIVTIPGKVTYNRVLASSTLNYNDADANTNDWTYLQLCEKLYDNDLRLTDGADDAMGRPSIEWSYKNDVIGTYATDADRVIVVDKEQTLAKELEDANKNWKMSWTVGNNTVETNVALNGGGFSGNVQVGDVVEVYMDGDTANAVGTVAITRYSMDEVTGAVATKGSTADDDLQIRIPGFIGYTDADKLNGDYNALEKDDIIYYYQDNDGVYNFAKADSFEGTYSGDKTGTPTKHIVDGDSYVANGSVAPLSLTKQTTYAFYTDANGYLIAAKEIEEAASDYVVIQDIKYAQGAGGINGSESVEARLVKMDGTTVIETVRSVEIGGTNYITGDGTNNLISSQDVATSVKNQIGKSFFTYSINSDKEYELTQVTADGDITTAALASNAEIKNGKVAMENVSGVAVNKNTVFVIATESGGKSFKVYNGISEVPDVVLASGQTPAQDVGVYVAENDIATHVYVGAYKSSSVSGDSVFFLSATEEAKLSKKDGDSTVYYNTFKAVVDGKYTIVEVKAKTDGSTDVTNTLTVGLFTPTYDEDGMITKIVEKTGVVESVANGYELKGGALVTSVGSYVCEDDALVFIMDGDGNVTEAEAADISKDENDSIYVVKTNSTDKVVDFLFIKEKADDDTSLSALSANGEDSATLTPALDKDAKEQTVAASAAGKKFTFTATPTDSTAAVRYSTNKGGDWKTSSDSGYNEVTVSAQDGDDVYMWIEVTSVDGSQTIYKITIETTKTT